MQIKSIKAYGRMMQDAFEQAVSSCLGEEICFLADTYTQEELDRFNAESNELYQMGCIDGAAEIPAEITNITFLGYFLLCFEEGQVYKEDIERYWQQQEMESDYEAVETQHSFNNC